MKGFYRSRTGSSNEKEKATVKDVDVYLTRPSTDSLESASNVDQPAGAFGNGGEGEVNYQTLSWRSASVMLIKSQIGVGVLSLPSAFETLGLVPGIIILVSFAVFATWADIYQARYKIKHPTVYSLQDAGKLMFGRIGSEVFGTAYWLFLAMVAGSALLTLSTSLNAVSEHGTCTAVFVAVSAIATYPIASVRKLENIRALGWIGLVSIMAALLTLTIAVPVGGRPALAPQEGPFDVEIVLFGQPTFAQGMNAVGTLWWAWCGGASFLPVYSEMRDIRDYKKAVAVSQSFVTTTYCLIATVVYCFAGQYVASPALGTAGVLIKKITYGIAIPGLLFTSVLNTHLSAKYLFFRFLRGSRHLTTPTKVHWGVWLGCTFGCLLFSYIVASAIPVFDGLVGLIGALLGAFLALNAQAMMFLHDHRDFWKVKEKRTPLLWFGMIANILLVLVASFIMVAGTYGSVLAIRDGLANGGGTSPFGCQDNSGSV
ncbi:hypothetical protein JCM11251_001346 [Rhodosporidiobolus azoricus]